MKCSIQVLVFVINLVMALAMSIDELEDFTNYLKETSLLDQPLKKNPIAGDDDDVPISDHAWEESGRFEGDLILNERQRQLIVQDIAEGLSRNGLKDSTKRWPNNEVIFYIQKEHFTSDQVDAILSGIEELSQASCVKFRPYRKGDRDAVVVQGSRRGCFSQVGYQGGYQVLNLSGRHPVGRGCFRHGTVVHEFLHTLGFYHMQSSPDRDDYIDVIWENIVQPARHNFRKYNLFSVSDFGVGYDYDSVLHYSRKAFSSNGGDTLVPKQSGVQIGQRIGLSEKDSAKLNKMYCDADSNNFEAADDMLHTLVIKKKKTPKNKPFEGHGIGYQQGKTVVFKLPPAETYQVSETPSIPVFDYFSKEPQDMPPTLVEGIGLGQKISYTSKLPAGYQIVEHKIPIFRYPALFSTTRNAIEPTNRQHTKQNKNVDNKTPNADVTTSSKSVESREESDERAIPTIDTLKNTDTINSNIYSNIYKPNTDYSEFYNPENNYDIGTKTDYYLNYSPSLKGKHGREDTEISNLKLTRQFIENLNVPKSIDADRYSEKKRERLIHQHELYDDKHDTTEKSKPITTEKTTSRDIDSSFGYVNPSRKLEELRSIYLLNPQYTSKKYLENKHDFSSLYYPSDNINKDPVSRNAQYRLFGELVPTNINYNASRKTNNDEELYKIPINRMDDEQSKESVAYPPYIPILKFKDDGNENNEYSYKEPYDSVKNADREQPTLNDENSSKPYKVTEKNVEPAALLTVKSNVESSEPQDAETKLEKRLPAILDSYETYDNYDITTPYIFSK